MTLRLLLLGTAMATSVALAAPHGFTVEDMVNMERVGSPVLSPDATKLVYTVRSTNMDKNRGNTQLWMIDLRAAKPVPQRLTQSDASSTDPEWSPNGDAIYFLSARSGSSQVWRLPLTGAALTRPVLSIGAEYSTALRPSLHVSQWRTNSWSKTWPLALVLALSSRRALVQARSAQSR